MWVGLALVRALSGEVVWLGLVRARVYCPFTGWITPVAWTLGLPIPPRLPLKKAVVRQRLPTDLHNCTVP